MPESSNTHAFIVFNICGVLSACTTTAVATVDASDATTFDNRVSDVAVQDSGVAAQDSSRDVATDRSSRDATSDASLDAGASLLGTWRGMGGLETVIITMAGTASGGNASLTLIRQETATCTAMGTAQGTWSLIAENRLHFEYPHVETSTDCGQARVVTDGPFEVSYVVTGDNLELRADGQPASLFVRQ